MGSDPAREFRQKVFIRVCRDSGFQLDPIQAAIIAAGVIGCHPLQMLCALDMDNMRRIADGSHPAATRAALPQEEQE
ncbi:MAG: hypothetical protein ABFE07_06435 [Armatimonadia bacterium]